VDAVPVASGAHAVATAVAVAAVIVADIAVAVASGPDPVTGLPGGGVCAETELCCIWACACPSSSETVESTPTINARTSALMVPLRRGAARPFRDGRPMVFR